MSSVAFLGLGMMGTPIATRLMEAGNDVTVWNRTTERAAALAPMAFAVATTPRDAVTGAEFVITMLATPEAVTEVLYGTDGAESGLEPGQVWIDMSTIGPEEFRGLVARLPAGVAAVDAPVRGSVPEATEGRLQVFIGADDPLYEKAQALLAPLGEVRHVGPLGSGAAAKLMVNLTLVTSMVAFGEAMALAEALGLDRTTTLDVLAESPIGSTVRAKRAYVEAGQFPPSFKLSLATKDMRLVDQAAVTAGLQLPAAKAAHRWMEAAVAEGAGDEDFSAVAATITAQATGSTGPVVIP
jgi:3-hydroxyisobutyrate dehydrogenase